MDYVYNKKNYTYIDSYKYFYLHLQFTTADSYVGYIHCGMSNTYS